MNVAVDTKEAIEKGMRFHLSVLLRPRYVVGVTLDVTEVEGVMHPDGRDFMIYDFDFEVHNHNEARSMVEDAQALVQVANIAKQLLLTHDPMGVTRSEAVEIHAAWDNAA